MIQPKLLPNFFDIIIVQIDPNTLSISLSLKIVSAFELEYQVVYFAISSLSIYFKNSITNIVTNLKHLNSINKCISLFLTADSVSLSCSSGSKKIQNSNIISCITFISMGWFCYLCIFFSPKLFQVLPFHYVKDYYNFCQY